MKELWAAIYDTLDDDETLTGLLGHTNTDRRIKRGWQPTLPIRPAVTYDLWSDVLWHVAQAKGNREPHEIMVRFSLWAPETVPAGQTVGADLLLSDLCAALLDALHGRDIATAALLCWLVLYDDFTSPLGFDEGLKCFTQVMRFKFIVKAA